MGVRWGCGGRPSMAVAWLCWLNCSTCACVLRIEQVRFVTVVREGGGGEIWHFRCDSRAGVLDGGHAVRVSCTHPRGDDCQLTSLA